MTLSSSGVLCSAQLRALILLTRASRLGSELMVYLTAVLVWSSSGDVVPADVVPCELPTRRIGNPSLVAYRQTLQQL